MDNVIEKMKLKEVDIFELAKEYCKLWNNANKRSIELITKNDYFVWFDDLMEHKNIMDAEQIPNNYILEYCKTELKQGDFFEFYILLIMDNNENIIDEKYYI